MIKAVFTGLLCFALFLALHIFIFRRFEPKERFRTLAAIFFSIVPLYALLYFLIPTGYMIYAPIGAASSKPIISLEAAYRITAVLNFLSGLFLYIFLFLGYCQFYFIVDRSISVRVMIEIENSIEKRLSFEELKKLYSGDEIFRRRLGHMVEGGYTRDISGYYANTPKGRFEARLFGFIKDLLKLGKGG